MQKSLFNITRVGVLALSVGLIGGCASTTDLVGVGTTDDAAAAKSAATGTPKTSDMFHKNMQK